MAIEQQVAGPRKSLLVEHVETRIAAHSRDADPDAGESPPTGAAVATCVTLLSQTGIGAGALTAKDTPRVTSMGEGDLILEWSCGDRRVLLFVLPSGTSRLQQVTGSGHSTRANEVARNSSPDDLRASVLWLAQ